MATWAKKKGITVNAVIKLQSDDDSAKCGIIQFCLNDFAFFYLNDLLNSFCFSKTSKKLRD